ncbi:MAG: Gfo/Idh/MocA family oxidoreductase [Candidatus Dormibacteraeota bacterium]|nr:Gfo/Idh/MocA family oxidoreductase [Candidatus Dormibacteraeota bacterium]
MTECRSVGVIMNGVTGRMGRVQHLARSVMAIRHAGGVPLPDGTRLMPEPVLVGRDAGRLRALAAEHGLERWSTDVDGCLGDPRLPIYFDTQSTERRADALRAAIAAGKHVYCEKPLAGDLATALDLARSARAAGIRHGVVQDKLWLPGIRKLRRARDSGLLGRVLSVKLDFGYWVFEGDEPAAQRPSWNYREEQGGGIVLDMYCHWQYLLSDLVGPVRGVFCRVATQVPERIDEGGRVYRATADDAAYGVLELEGGTIAHVASSWCTRPRRDDLLVIQIDGTKGSAVAGLRRCWVQPRAATRPLTWDPDAERELHLDADWIEVPSLNGDTNAFREEWERFLRHVVIEEPFRWDFFAGAEAVQLAELALQSDRERRWMAVPALDR